MGVGPSPVKEKLGRLCAVKDNVVGKKETKEMGRDELREKLQIRVGGE